jgi:homoserine dehydrogenase
LDRRASVDVRLAMTGFGNVGRGVAELLAQHRSEYEERYGVRLLLTAVADRGGVAIDAAGLDEVEILRNKLERGSVAGLATNGTASVGKEFLLESKAHVLIEAASTNFEDAEPGWSLIQSALNLQLDVVMASKGALVLHYAELMDLAASRGKTVSHSATIGAPLPVLDLINRTLVGTKILGFEGVLNSTSNVILQAMVDGRSYDDGVRLAQEMGIAETDPTLDVDGWDAAAKAAIVANAAFGSSLGISDVAREGIREVTVEQIQTAAREGDALKLLSMASLRGGRVVAEVRVVRRGPSHPLGRLRGSEMGIMFHTDPLGDFTATVENLGASGGIATASTVLRDVLNLASVRGWNSDRSA